MKVLILGYFGDMQTGIYIMEAMKKFAHDVAAVDTRRIIQDVGTDESQKIILEEIEDLKINPDVILVLKGLELHPDTLEIIKKKYPEATTVNWLFDKYVGGMEVWKNKQYIEFIKQFDYFLCSLKGTSDRLKNVGLTNTYWLPEATSLEYNGRTYLNHFQQEKYGEDISFVGTLGLVEFHKYRLPVLKQIAKEGYRMKIWGEIACDWRLIPNEIRNYHMTESAINEKHSKVVQCSKINLGIDQDHKLELGQSARMYRVMSAGGFYFTNYVPKLETMFKINKDGELPTDDLDLVVYYSYEDLLNKLDWLLENNEIREKIAMNGMKKVIENHTFTHRCEKLLNMIKKQEKEMK